MRERKKAKQPTAYATRFSKAELMTALLAQHLGELWRTKVVKCEYRFHPDRKWAFDVAVLDWNEPEKLAFEIEGGIWVKGAHVRGKHFLSDMEKYNHAAALNWRVFRFTPQQVETGAARAWIKENLL